MARERPYQDRGDDHAAAEIRIGVSACILGAEVRFNGGHKLDRFIRDTLGQFFTFVPVCPEVGIDLGVPRETLRLVKPVSGGHQLRLQAPKSGLDHTETMLRYARAQSAALANEELCGFILQKNSPSCGMERVKVYPLGESGAPARNGRGLFAQVLMERMPFLPVEEDGRLNDPLLRENFIVRIFAYRRLRACLAGRWALRDLIAFHSREKLLLLAHHRPGLASLGQLVARAAKVPREQLAEKYSSTFLGALARHATRRKNTNVLQHIAGYFKKQLDGADRAELREIIESYRLGHVPLVVPITLLRHHIRRHGPEYLAEQTYLEPHPLELMLRNHV